MGSVDTWVGYWGRLRPARAAVATNARAVTWKSLNERAGHLAAGLAAEGALGGSRIGVRSSDPVAVIEVIAACARLGTVAVPVDSGDDQDLIPPDCVGITLAAAAEPTGIAATLGALHAGAASPSPPLLSARRSCGSGRPALLFRDRTITWAEFGDRVVKRQLRSLGGEP